MIFAILLHKSILAIGISRNQLPIFRKVLPIPVQYCNINNPAKSSLSLLLYVRDVHRPKNAGPDQARTWPGSA